MFYVFKMHHQSNICFSFLFGFLHMALQLQLHVNKTRKKENLVTLVMARDKAHILHSYTEQNVSQNKL